ncbi:MAG: amidohydrolase family protein [Parcubacteria group bacterium]|nr:amidohydrolase family protein [Parcubacteria group bacterium]
MPSRPKGTTSVISVALLGAILLSLAFFVDSRNTGEGALSAVGETQNSKESKCALKPKAREFTHEPYYTGPLIDAHVHIPVSSGIVSIVGRKMGFKEMVAFGGALTPDYLACLFKSEGITKAFGFFLTTKFSLGSEVSAAKKFEKNHPGTIVPFFMPGVNDTLRVATSTIKSTFEKNKRLFKGLGEIKSFDGSSLDAQHLLDHYSLAKEYKLVVMMHPYKNHRAAVERILSKYPTVKFLMHGNEDGGWLMEVIAAHPNAFYSLDGNIVSLYGWEQRHFTERGPTKEEFLAHFREHFDSILNQEIRKWKWAIEAYPNRFMWGTDRWYGWHFDYEVGGVLEEFGRSFIGRLDPAVRENFAYKNAQALLR